MELKDKELEEKDLNEVQTELWVARAKWRKIGLNLKILAGDLDVIEQDGSDVDAKFEKTILKWLRIGKTCTWNILCEALSACTVNHNELADNIRKRRCPKAMKIERGQYFSLYIKLPILIL